MQVREALYAVLKAIPALSKMPIRPLVAQPADKPPYVVYTQISGQRVKSLAGDSGLANPHIQIDVYAADIVLAGDLQKAIRDAVLASPVLGAVHLDEGDGYEPEAKLYRCRQDFSLWVYD